MRVNLELNDLLDMLGNIAAEARNDARIQFSGSQADAVTMGIAFLLKQIREAFTGAEDYDMSPDESDAQTMQKAISGFCLKWCYHSRNHPPGSAEQCPTCPLMVYTIGAVEKVVDRVMGIERQPQDPRREFAQQAPRHGFDPQKVAEARRRLEQQIKEGE